MKNDIRDVYEQVGNLFYAIAADQHVKPLEVPELKMLVNREWMPGKINSREHLVSDAAHCILVTMDSLQADKVSSSDAFNRFTKYYNLNSEAFTPDIKSHILETASTITKIFPQKSVSNEHLSALNKMFQLRYV